LQARTDVAMGTLLTIQVRSRRDEAEEALDRAFRWFVGVRHRQSEGELIGSLQVSNQAVCTSGDYERPGHILHPRTGMSPRSCASATVVAPSAMLADALATAAFVLGPQDSLALLESYSADGLIVTADLQPHKTGGLLRVA
jgi:FAD:protein FMN transferase